MFPLRRRDLGMLLGGFLGGVSSAVALSVFDPDYLDPIYDVERALEIGSTKMYEGKISGYTVSIERDPFDSGGYLELDALDERSEFSSVQGVDQDFDGITYNLFTLVSQEGVYSECFLLKDDTWKICGSEEKVEISNSEYLSRAQELLNTASASVPLTDENALPLLPTIWKQIQE